MHPPSRTRRILKWTGVALSLLVLAAMFASFRYECTIVITRHLAMHVDSGYLRTAIASFDFASDLHLKTEVGVRSPLSPMELWSGPTMIPFFEPTYGGSYGWIRPKGNAATYHTSFWTLILVAAIPTAWLWHRDRQRIRPGHCAHCGYDLTGNLSGKCSECGAPASSSPRVAAAND